FVRTPQSTSAEHRSNARGPSELVRIQGTSARAFAAAGPAIRGRGTGDDGGAAVNEKGPAECRPLSFIPAPSCAPVRISNIQPGAMAGWDAYVARFGMRQPAPEINSKIAASSLPARIDSVTRSSGTRRSLSGDVSSEAA